MGEGGISTPSLHHGGLSGAGAVWREMCRATAETREPPVPWLSAVRTSALAVLIAKEAKKGPVCAIDGDLPGAYTAQIRTYLRIIPCRQNFFDEFAQTGQPLPPAARHVHVNLASRRFAGA
jgi:hypothetical protein